MAEGWTTKKVAQELNVDLSTLQRWRKKSTGPEWKHNKSGACIYLASSVQAYKMLKKDNPWEREPEKRVAAPMPAHAMPIEYDEAQMPQFIKDDRTRRLAEEAARPDDNPHGFTLPKRK